MSRPTVVTLSRVLETGPAEQFFPVRGEIDVILSVWTPLSGSNGKHPFYSLLAIGQGELSIWVV